MVKRIEKEIGKRVESSASSLTIRWKEVEGQKEEKKKKREKVDQSWSHLKGR
jgi:hypothetical protein